MRTSKTIAGATRILEEALLTACDEGDLDRATKMIKNGANMNMVCESGRTPLCSVAHSGNLDILRVMIDHAKGRDISTKSSVEGIEYSTDSDLSDGETSPDGKNSVSEASPDHKDESKSKNPPCNCSETGAGASCEHGAGNASATKSEPVFKMFYYTTVARKHQRKKLLPLEIQAILKTFSTDDDTDDIDEYDMEEDDDDDDDSTVGKHDYDSESSDSDEGDDGTERLSLSLGGSSSSYSLEGITAMNAYRGNEDALGEETSDDGLGGNTPEHIVVEDDGVDESHPEICSGGNNIREHEGVNEHVTSSDVSVLERVRGNVPGNTRRPRIPRCNTSTWRSGIFRKTDCLIRKIPNPKSLNKKDHFGCKPIHYATVGGHLEALKLLINAGCKINVGDEEHLYPVHMAAARDSPEVLLLLISSGAQINVKSRDKVTPLHVAASRGLLENIKILVREGALLNALDKVDRSPLYIAVSRSHSEVVSYLLSQGAKMNIEEIHGYTPLYEAVSQRNSDVLRILLAEGAKISYPDNLLHHAVLYKSEDVIRELIQAGCSVNGQEENGDTALIVAAKTSQPRMVKILLEHGALVNMNNSIFHENAFVLMTKNYRGKFRSYQKIFKLFLQYDLEIDWNTGFKAVYYAIYNSEPGVAAFLIRQGVITFENLSDANNESVLDVLLEALNRDYRVFVKLLVYAGYSGFRHMMFPEEESSSLVEWLRQYKSNPLTLAELCRIVVRSKLKNKIFKQVSFLNVPSPIQSYIKMENMY